MKKEFKNRKAFNFFRSYWETASKLPDADRLKFYDALLSKQFTGVEPELDGLADLVYTSQRHSIEAQINGYITKVQGINKCSTEAPKQAPTEGGAAAPTRTPKQAPHLQEKEQGKEQGKGKEKEQLNLKMCEFCNSQDAKNEVQEIAISFYRLFQKHETDLNTAWPSLKKVSAQKFCDPIRLMIERDGITKNDLRDVWQFLNGNTESAIFWKKQVQSSEGLRKKFEKLLTQARNNTNSNGTKQGFNQNTPDGVKQGLEYLLRNDA